MFDLVSAIASVDPPSFAVGLVWLFAIGMYPVGIMLGSSCSPCCGCSGPCETNADCRSGCYCVNGQCNGTPPCTQCTEGELPDTVTVTFDGYQDKTAGPDLISVEFSSCYGGGASARVGSPGGDPETDKGPIGTVTLISGGSGYAKFGRIAPTVSASGGSGIDASFTVSLTSSNDSCNIPHWSVSAVSVKGGTQYRDGDQLVFSVADDDTEQEPASATIHTTRNEPTITASAAGGIGATFSVSVSKNPGTPSTWFVDGVTLTSGGSGYPSMGSVTFSKAAGDVEEYPAYAYFYSGRTTPTLSASVSSGGGSGATLSVSLSSSTGWDGRTYWHVSSIGVTDGGTGYAENDPVDVTVTDGEASMYTYFSARVSAVDKDGAITEVTVDYGGEYFKNTGVIDSVELWSLGSYYNDDGVPASVSVENAGIYYREDATASPYVATVTVTLSQSLPSAGTGATLIATVESNTSSPNFGKITGLAIDSGGDGYLAWKWVSNACCGWQLNGKSIVLRRLTDYPWATEYSPGGPFINRECVYGHDMCGGWQSAFTGNTNFSSNGIMGIRAFYRGTSTPPAVSIMRAGPAGTESLPPACTIGLVAEDPITNCSDFSFTASDAGGSVTATVTPGGQYDSTYKKNGPCTICCQGHEEVPGEIEVEVVDRGYYGGDRSGTYVLGSSSYGWFYWHCEDDYCTVAFNIRLTISQGSCGSQDSCDQCVKKCEISGGASLHFRPYTWYQPPDEDMRNCLLHWASPPLTAEEQVIEYCEKYCFDVPLCSPPSGFTISTFQPNGSDHWSSGGCPNCCDENTQPQWQPGDPFFGPYTGPPRPDHRNTFTMTVV